MKLLGGLLGGGMSRGGSADMVGAMLQQALGGGTGSGGGGLGGMLSGALGGGSSSGGGLGAMLGGALGGNAGGAGGGLGGLLGGVAMAALGKFAAGQVGGGGVSTLLGGDDDAGMDVGRAEQHATLLIRAMFHAARSDGRIDSAEEAAILERLGDVDDDERALIQREMAAEVDPEGLARAVPPGSEQEVYAVSLMAIDLDSQAEASYMHRLATALGLDAERCNAIHRQMGEPEIYG